MLHTEEHLHTEERLQQKELTHSAQRKTRLHHLKETPFRPLRKQYESVEETVLNLRKSVLYLKETPSHPLRNSQSTHPHRSTSEHTTSVTQRSPAWNSLE